MIEKRLRHTRQTYTFPWGRYHIIPVGKEGCAAPTEPLVDLLDHANPWRTLRHGGKKLGFGSRGVRCSGRPRYVERNCCLQSPSLIHTSDLF
jgi:hypothetical protein